MQYCNEVSIKTSNKGKRHPLIRLNRFRRKVTITMARKSAKNEKESKHSLNGIIVTIEPRTKKGLERNISRLSTTSESVTTPDDLSQIFAKMFSDYHEKLHHRKVSQPKISKSGDECVKTNIRENAIKQKMFQSSCFDESLLAYLEEDSLFDDDTSDTSSCTSSSSSSSSSSFTMISSTETMNAAKLLIERMSCCFMA